MEHGAVCSSPTASGAWRGDHLQRWNHDHAVAPGSTRVVVTPVAEDGGTRVVLRHYNLSDDEQRDHHLKGWEMYLERLSVLMSGGEPGPDPSESKTHQIL
ncbi:MAG: SRPBCC domain-containing protein [Dermatophilaceae bacterium]